MLRILDEVVDAEDEQLTEKLFDRLSGSPDENRIQTAWNTLYRYPIEARRRRVKRWLYGEARIGSDKGVDIHPRTVAATESALNQLERSTSEVISNWADLFTDRVALQDVFDLNAPSEFSDSELDKVHDWCVQIHHGLDNEDKEETPVIDQEDEAILLRLHQRKIGWLRHRGGKLDYDHLLIDEAQDFSPIEIAVLMETVGRKQPVTFAGDTAQKIVRESGFVSWNALLADLGLRGSKIAPLKIAYRSTIEIMRLSHDVLGPYVGDKPNATRHGAPVELHQFSDPGQAVGFLGEALRDLAIREPMANVAVIARHISQARAYFDGLKKSEIPRLNFVVEEDFSFVPGVEVTDVRQVKGLEFDYVVLVEVNAESYPDNEESRHLLHVGATRAAHQLWIFSTGKPSPILPDWLLQEE
jgi:DNA helicase-2/ATP-dependent DNA helicase PcrA